MKYLVHPCTPHHSGKPLKNFGTPYGVRYTRLASTALNRCFSIKLSHINLKGANQRYAKLFLILTDFALKGPGILGNII